MVFDKAGNLYGSTVEGGNSTPGYGIVYELMNTDGGWKEKILFDFNSDSSGKFGIAPFGSLVFDNAGNLYGTTVSGGPICCGGTVFELKPTSDGPWQESVIDNFGGASGYFPNTLVFDSAGNLYGTTTAGGSGNYGTVFELKPSGDAWTESVLHSFQSNPKDGAVPDSGLLVDAKGNLYGTTQGGGAFKDGTLFQIKP